jgi:hypothetical protein
MICAVAVARRLIPDLRTIAVCEANKHQKSVAAIA